MPNPELLASVKAALGSQLVGGGLVLMLTGAVLALLRQVPTRIWGFVRRQAIVTLDIQEKDSSYFWVSQWLDRHPYSKKAREISVLTLHERQEPTAVYTPAPGVHLFWFRRRPVWLTRTREKTPHGTSETLQFRTFGRSTQFFRDLIEEAREIALRPDKDVAVFVANVNYWQKVSTFAARPLNTVVLPDGVSERVEADIRNFRASQEWYVKRGIPWRRGYLFYGAPGTGKTSLISALAGAVGFNLYVLNLAANGLSDEGLVQLLLNVPKGAAILLDDIDAVLDGRSVKQNGGSNPSTVSFTGLLNALDGVATRPGLIVFITTNHLEKLDPALVRPGRADVKVEFTQATADQIATLFARFYGNVPSTMAEEFGKLAAGNRSMADVQEHLLEYRDSSEEALRVARERWGVTLS
jgi:chaperone BCS1